MNVISIQIINIKLIKQNNDDKKSNLKAICDFKLNDSEFYSWRIIQQDNQHAWVSPPQESRTDESGSKKYKPLVKFKPSLMKDVSTKLIEEYEKELSK
jgi:hypothetical protein